MKKTNNRIVLKRENIRNLNAVGLALVMGGGRTSGSVVVNDCAVQCTQSCNQCTYEIVCVGDTSNTTF